jgi:hypothetical protein
VQPRRADVPAQERDDRAPGRLHRGKAGGRITRARVTAGRAPVLPLPVRRERAGERAGGVGRRVTRQEPRTRTPGGAPRRHRCPQAPTTLRCP